MKTEVIDMFDIMMDETVGEEKSSPAAVCSVGDALIKCLNERGCVDLGRIAELGGVSTAEAAKSLRGAIFQQPEAFRNTDVYDATSGWVLAAAYLGGNIREKLRCAREMNKRFGKFGANITALEKMLPAQVGIDDIHISLGATWIPTEEYEAFIKDFLKLRKDVKVIFYKDLLSWKIVPPNEAATSVLNTITYGVRENTESDGFCKQYLTAINIIEQTMNAKTIKVYDYIPNGTYRSGFSYEPVFNASKTLEAMEIQRKILDAFKDWGYKNIKLFEEYYNSSYVGYCTASYNGDFLELPDLNPEVRLYKHQRDAVARALLSEGNLLFAHDVGTGKTYEMIISVHELHRCGLSRRNLVVVPNNILGAFEDAHRYLYPDDKILVVYPKDFALGKRNSVLSRMRDGEYTAMYMAYSSFDMIVMSKDYKIDKLMSQMKQLKMAKFNAETQVERDAIAAQIKVLGKKLSKCALEEKECPWMCFEELGIETLVIDEAHNYKNIPINTRATGIVGMGNSLGSKKCREMLEKTRNVRRVIMATGTPLTNSLADLYAFMNYLQPKVLKFHEIASFDMWINTFGQRETTIECDVDANSTSLRTMTRFSSFHNLPELMALFSQVCDFHHTDENVEGLPAFNGYEEVCVPKNEAQDKRIREMSERVDKIRGKKVKRTEDNLLKVTSEGRMVAVDIRFVEPDAYIPSLRGTKAGVCAEKVRQLYDKYPGSVQIIFSDIGIPKKNEFNIYDELRERLICEGIPGGEIAFIHDATTEKARSAMFRDMNNGRLRVVIGSTQKLGVGVNVQERLVAIHHLSIPWRPADMVQREGRILRKGNTSEEVFILRYVTEGSFDAYSWQLLENKQRFIASFLSGTASENQVSDIADTVLSYAEVKALAIGNPLIKNRVEVANSIDRMKIASRGRQKQLQELRAVVELAPAKIEDFVSLSEIAKADHKDFTESKETVHNSERIAFGEELLEALSRNAFGDTERIFDAYRGFVVVLPSDMLPDEQYIIIKSKNGGSWRCDLSEDATPLGCSKKIDWLLEHLDERAEKLADRAEDIRKQMAEAEADIATGNQYTDMIKVLEDELSEIDRRIEEATDIKKGA